MPLWSQLSLIDEFHDWAEHALSASSQLPDKNHRGKMQLYATLGGLQMYAISSVRPANNAWECALTLATSWAKWTINFACSALFGPKRSITASFGMLSHWLNGFTL